MNIVIDTNILTSALIKDSKTRSLIIKSNQTFLLPEFELIEIKNHKPEILRKSGLSDMEFNSLFVNMLKYVKIIKCISNGHMSEANRRITSHFIRKFIATSNPLSAGFSVEKMITTYLEISGLTIS